ncbi:hypothetical protein AYI70_g6210 [Smittium culicis]|uniref:Zn(2)-C6 fungal-type domain-containing protein n=1 Tax=Smittium culicis TaxID=133412 RepID=A0A1R1XIF7_9FUNG|nr:hypothetical protein AYI70_g7881 [Smittium culicis]OMJ17064.1 hypothetical protein AYI70_g6210 [Smittium culicis]
MKDSDYVSSSIPLSMNNCTKKHSSQINKIKSNSNPHVQKLSSSIKNSKIPTNDPTNLNYIQTIPFKTLDKGKSCYSCEICTKKRIKCEGTRPICIPCQKFDRLCNYKESSLSEIDKDIESINKRLENIKKALERIGESTNINQKINDFNSKGALSKDKDAGIVLFDYLENSSSGNCPTDPCLDAFSSIKSKISGYNSVLEYGYLDLEDDLLHSVFENFFTKSFFSFLLSKNHALYIKKDYSVPNYMKYAFLSFSVKLADQLHLFKDHLYMCGSVYAKKSLDHILSTIHEISIEKVISLLILSVHYTGIAKINTATFLLNLATKYSISLGMHKIDCSRLKTKKTRLQWFKTEFKRRIWWLVYILNISNNLNLGSPSWIHNGFIAVDLPSHDSYFFNFDPDDPDSNLEFTPRNNVDNRENTDTCWLVIKVYIELGIVTNFINRKRLNGYKKSKENLAMFENLNKRIDTFEIIYKNHFKGLALDVDNLIPVEKLGKKDMSNKFFEFFCCGLIFRLARTILNNSQLVIYSLDPIQLSLTKRAKMICIETTIEIYKILKWSNESLYISHYYQDVFYSAATIGSILFNCSKIYDHPKYRILKNYYKDLFINFEDYIKYFFIANDFENAVKHKHGIYLKSIQSNNKLKLHFPELKIIELTPLDTNLWFISPVTSSWIYLCCSINSKSPIYKYIFMENWFGSEILKTRSPEFFNKDASTNILDPQININLNKVTAKNKEFKLNLTDLVNVVKDICDNNQNQSYNSKTKNRFSKTILDQDKITHDKNSNEIKDCLKRKRIPTVIKLEIDDMEINKKLKHVNASDLNQLSTKDLRQKRQSTSDDCDTRYLNPADTRNSLSISSNANKGYIRNPSTREQNNHEYNSYNHESSNIIKPDPKDIEDSSTNSSDEFAILQVPNTMCTSKKHESKAALRNILNF